ncbi:MAG: RidA family protein [Planctomycetota bacterium]
MRKHISTGSPFEKQAGYSRALVDGDWCFVSGTTGYDYENMEMPESVVQQTRNALGTISDTLEQAGFDANDIIRANYIVTEVSFADEVFPVLGEFFADIRPAATMIVAGLVRPEMKVEIEVTARKRKT